MAGQALEIDLKNETEYLAKYEKIRQAVEELFDLRSNTLATLIHSCLQNDNKVLSNRRRQFAGQCSEDVFDLIETIAGELSSQRACS